MIKIKNNTNKRLHLRSKTYFFYKNILMEISNQTDFRICLVKKEYDRYAQILRNMSIHIEVLYKNGIYDNDKRIDYCKELNELIKTMNNTYNEKMIELDKKEEIKCIPYLSFCDANVHTVFDICKYYDDFKSISNKIIKFGAEIGFHNIYDAINILLGLGFLNSIKGQKTTIDGIDHDVSELLKFYNSMFVPINHKICNTPLNKNILVVSNIVFGENIQTGQTIISPNEILLDSYGEISILFANKSKALIIGGYFLPDPVQSIVRTSQIYNEFIYNRKKKIQSAIKTVVSGNLNYEKFADIYFKNITYVEILCFTSHGYVNKLKDDYEKYSKYSKCSQVNFRLLLEEFTKDTHGNIISKYDAIRLLLLGGIKHVDMAGILIGCIKDKKMGSEYISEIIYRRLNYTLQTKLKIHTMDIENELEKIKTLNESDTDTKKIVASNLSIPIKIKKIIYDKLEEQKYNNGETYKNKIYIDILSNFPWHDNDDIFVTIDKDDTKCKELLDKVAITLNNKVYGHINCKRAIQEIVCKWIKNPKSTGKALGLIGPPGVGKTLIAKGLGDALGIPCCSISLCGVEDPVVLNGHSFTYSGAQPGWIVRKMADIGKARCVMFFDELDKTCQKHGTNEIQSIFINLTDQNMNSSFTDKFFQEVTFPLDKVLFVFSYNDRNKIDKILLNRIHEIDVKAYTTNDKLQIFKNFLLNEVCKDYGTKPGSIEISNEDIEFIIEEYTYEPGVRELKRKLETLLSRAIIDRIYKRGAYSCNCKKNSKKVCNCDNCGQCNKCKNCEYCNITCSSHCSYIDLDIIKLERKDIIKYLKEPHDDIEKINNIDRIGSINGLYATNIGYGGIIKILVYKNLTGKKNHFDIVLTGNQGKIMVESVKYAFTIASNLLKKEYIDIFYKEFSQGLHVHVPSGSTPKEGPSAGAAFTSAIISRILGKHIKRNIAMTGEIGEVGEIKKIGGLLYKLRGAKKAGVTKVFVPLENKKDIETIKEEDKTLISNGVFDVQLVSHISEILDQVLIEDNNMQFQSEKYIENKFFKFK